MGINNKKGLKEIFEYFNNKYFANTIEWLSHINFITSLVLIDKDKEFLNVNISANKLKRKEEEII